MNELKLHMFLEESNPQFVEGMLKMFYHAINVGRVGMAEIKGELYLVGLEPEEEDSSSLTYYPLAKVLGAEEAEALVPAGE